MGRSRANMRITIRLHETLNERTHPIGTDLAGGFLGEADLKQEQLSAGSDSEPTADGEEPNDYEKRTLRRVGENLPFVAFLVAIVELTERFTFYGASGLFQNYISNARDGSNGAKGLGLGHQAGTGLNLFFQWFCYGLSCPFLKSQPWKMRFMRNTRD